MSNTLYERAKQIAEAKGLKIGGAIVEAGQELAPSVSICEEEGFKQELRKIGISPPKETKWLFGFLDNFTPEMLKGSKLSPYAEARAKSKAVCSLLPGAEEVIGASTGETEGVAEPTAQSELVAGVEASEGESTEPPQATEPTAENV